MKKDDLNKKKISRRKSIKKIGLTALSASTMMVLLNEPAKAQDTPDSPDIPPEW